MYHCERKAMGQRWGSRREETDRQKGRPGQFLDRRTGKINEPTKTKALGSNFNRRNFAYQINFSSVSWVSGWSTATKVGEAGLSGVEVRFDPRPSFLGKGSA